MCKQGNSVQQGKEDLSSTWYRDKARKSKKNNVLIGFE